MSGDSARSFRGETLAETSMHDDFFERRGNVSHLNLSLQPACYPDIAVRREVKKLQVVCSNKQFGCDFIGNLENYFNVRKSSKLAQQ